MKYINFSQLRSFHAVAKTGSITQASKLLSVSQPTITKQLQLLESFYQINLINRHARGISLTELGKKLYEITLKIFELEEEAIHLEEDVDSVVVCLQPRLGIADLLNVGLFEDVLPPVPLPEKLFQQHPVVSFRVLRDARIEAVGGQLGGKEAGQYARDYVSIREKMPQRRGFEVAQLHHVEPSKEVQ